MPFSIRDEIKSLCVSCRYSTVIRSTNENDAIIRCRFLDVFIKKAVKSCSSFSDVARPSSEHYEKIAWIVDTRGGKMIGFVKPGTKRHSEMVEDE